MLQPEAMTEERELGHQLRHQLRHQRRFIAFTMLIALASLAVAIRATFRTPDRLRFVGERVETVIDAYGVTSRTLDGTVSAKLDGTGLTLTAGTDADKAEFHATVEATRGFRHRSEDVLVGVANGGMFATGKDGSVGLSAFGRPSLALRHEHASLSIGPTQLLMLDREVSASLMLNTSARSVGLALQTSRMEVSARAEPELGSIRIEGELPLRRVNLWSGLSEDDPASVSVRTGTSERSFHPK